MIKERQANSMIPIGDSDRRPLRFSIVTVSIIATNIVIFVLELLAGNGFVRVWALVPAQIMAGQHWITLLTAMFLHSGWLHIISNMLFLYVFGPPMEDRLGSGRFFFLYILGGLAAMIAQIAVAPHSTIPVLGASGAIAAVMGAFLLTYPDHRITTVIFLGFFLTVVQIRAFIVVGLWFVIQLFSQVGALAGANVASGGVAYMAHIGGFLAGLVLAFLFIRRRRNLNAGWS